MFNTFIGDFPSHCFFKWLMENALRNDLLSTLANQLANWLKNDKKALYPKERLVRVIMAVIMEEKRGMIPVTKAGNGTRHEIRSALDFPVSIPHRISRAFWFGARLIRLHLRRIWSILKASFLSVLSGQKQQTLVCFHLMIWRGKKSPYRSFPINIFPFFSPNYPERKFFYRD